MSRVEPRPAGEAPAKFRLDKDDGKFLGACAGLARYLGIDPTIVRLVLTA